MRVRITQSKKRSSDEGECAEASMRKIGENYSLKSVTFCTTGTHLI